MGLSFVSNTLSMSGSSVTPDGAVTAVEDKCGGGTFGGSDPSAPCSGTLIGPLIVFDIGTIADLTETTSDFAMTSFFDVFTEIAVDGGLDGSASLGTVTTEFGFVPTGHSRTDIDAASGLRTGRRAPAAQTALNADIRPACDGLNFFEKGGNSAKTHTPVLRDPGRMACGVPDRHRVQSPRGAYYVRWTTRPTLRTYMHSRVTAVRITALM